MANVPASSIGGAYEYSLDTDWDLAFQSLTSDAQLLLEYIAFLDPSHIQADLFVGNENSIDQGRIISENTENEWKYWQTERFNDAVMNLRERHLVDRYLSPSGDCLKTHQAIQRSILQDLDKDPVKRDQTFGQVVSILRKALPTVNIIGRSDESQSPVFAKYLPQVLFLHTNFKQSHQIKANLKFVELIADVGFYCRTQDETTALPALYTAEGICGEVDDSKLDETESRYLLKLKADILSLIAIIVKPRGKEGQAKALEYIDRIIQLREEELKDVPQEQWTELQGTNMHRAVVDKALTLCYADRVEEAAPLFERAEEYYKSVGNEVRLYHVRVMYLWVLATRQNRTETRKAAHAALSFMVEKLGDDNPLTQQSRARIGGVFFTIGDVEQAAENLETVFKWRLVKYGHLHDESLGAQYTLAVCRQHLGDFKKAETELREILRIGQVTEEWRVEDVMRVKFRLYLVLKMQERVEEASEVRREMQSYLDKIMGRLQHGAEGNDKEIMEILDSDIVSLDHGRTAGIWSNGELW